MDQSNTANPNDPARVLLVCRLGDRVFGLPAEHAERVLRMAQLTSLTKPSGNVVGVLNLQGDVLPVVDPRPLLGLPTMPFHQDQRLVVIGRGTRYALWFDDVERIVSVSSEAVHVLPAASADGVVREVVHLVRETLPLLSLDALQPVAPATTVECSIT